jgi:dUTP pyrophosphatase
MIRSFNNISFLDHPEPVLTIEDKEYYGINILTKLDQLKKSNDLHNNTKYIINSFYKKASLYYNQDKIPVLKYKLNHPFAVAPTKDVENVGYDLTVIKEHKRISKNTVIYDTGVSFQFPLGWYGAVYPRSSISNTGYMMSNSVAIIDSGYTGNVKISLTKIDTSLPNLELPMRIAQLVLTPYINSKLEFVKSDIEFIETNRKDGGFGSTGLVSDSQKNEVDELAHHCYSQ